jgi:mannose/fructose-specific phosphotransferase system component IIA
MNHTRALGILVTHGTLGTELLRTSEAILGPQTDIEVISNSGTSLESLSDRVRTLVGGHPEMTVFLFVDLQGGSCGHACQEIRRLHPDTVLVTGVNLPMLLEFLHNRDRVSVAELKERILKKGRDGIACL